MKKNIIVTVKTSDENSEHPFNYDMEIPLDAKFAVLSYDILELIYQENKDVVYGSLKGNLYCERLHHNFENNETPASSGLLNGDILIIN